MQYIQKEFNEPPGWRALCAGVGLTTNYYDVRNTEPLRQLLLDEQRNLCAYCQRSLTLGSSSIEHVIPHSCNKNLSTSYHNLVAVCRESGGNEDYCEPARGNAPIVPIIFYENCKVEMPATATGVVTHGPHPFFSADSSGYIRVKLGGAPEAQAIQGFVDVLWLNHDDLTRHRREVFKSFESAWQNLSGFQKRKAIKNKIDSILRNPGQPLRQYLLLALRSKLGMN